MRGYMLGALLAVGLVAAGAAWAEDDGDFDKAMQNIELQKKQMDLQQHHAEMEFQQALRNLELEKKKVELDRQLQMMKMMPPGGPQMNPRMQGGMPGNMPQPGMGRCGMMGQGGCSDCVKMKGPEVQGKGPDIRHGGDKFHHGPPRCCKAGMFIIMLCMCIIHVLVAVWVSRDIRQRNSGSGVWVAIALLAGLMGALVYAVVRIGDNKVA